MIMARNGLIYDEDKMREGYSSGSNRCVSDCVLNKLKEVMMPWYFLIVEIN